MKKVKTAECGTETTKEQRLKKNLLKIMCRLYQKTADRVEDILFHFYFITGENR